MPKSLSFEQVKQRQRQKERGGKQAEQQSGDEERKALEARYEEVTGEKAGKKKDATLIKAIEQAEQQSGDEE